MAYIGLGLLLGGLFGIYSRVMFLAGFNQGARHQRVMDRLEEFQNGMLQ